MESTFSQYSSTDGKVGVIGHWIHRGGSLYIGEVTVFAANKVMRFSSTTPLTSEGLSGYATPEYLARHASKFVAR